MATVSAPTPAVIKRRCPELPEAGEVEFQSTADEFGKSLP